MNLARIYDLLSRMRNHYFHATTPAGARYWEARRIHFRNLCKAKGWDL